MARARFSGGHEGHAGVLITDAKKAVCPYCGGTQFMFSMTADSVNDAAHGPSPTLSITAAGSTITGMVFLCKHCGHEHGRLIWIIDTCAGVAGAAITMTNLDASVANGLAAAKVIPLGGTDVLKEFTVSSNTAAAPTVITLSVAPNADTNGELVLITSLDTEHTAAA